MELNQFIEKQSSMICLNTPGAVGGLFSFFFFFYPSRLLPNRSLVAWGARRIALGALIFHSNAFPFICCAPKFSAFSSEGPFKIWLGSSLALIVTLKIKDG